MKHTQDAHCLLGDIIDEQIVAMDDQLARARHAPWATERRVRKEISRLAREHFVERQSRDGVLIRDVLARVAAILACFHCPEKLHA
ncbi:hypothetical protein SAMN05518801_102157 [Novosphingobium sp. CF614]|nr:hypothetical protein SAMN05518801_102157 [Novosphingobium sp. CF614]